MKVFYSPRQSVAQSGSFSPSPGKPRLLVEQWRQRFPGIEIVEPAPATVEELCAAHDPVYVREVLACRRSNGFGNTSPALAESFPWTCGSFLSAARWAAEHGGCVCSPTSGFHHACYENGGGFCTFNGLMVAAMALSHLRVGILDCDFHYGNGTDDILRRKRVRHVEHHTTGNQRYPAEEFLERLPSILADMNPQILFYQAGADAYVGDPLGGWMDEDQLRQRDRAVFRFCSEARVPVVWNLAGGYQDDIQRVLDLHHITMEESFKAYPLA